MGLQNFRGFRLSLATLPITQSCAGSTDSVCSVIPEGKILSAERVSVLALSNGSEMSPCVLSLRNCFKVIGTDAEFRETEVVYNKTFRDRADTKFVSNTMSELVINLTVAVASICCSPEPTSVGLVDLRPESFGQGSFDIILTHGEPQFHCAVGSSAQCSAPHILAG
jgi:hypothetical protein